MAAKDSHLDGILAAKPDEEGAGLAERRQALLLRVFTSHQGRQWLNYGGIVGGWQDDAGFVVFYHGLLTYDGKVMFGYWQLIVKGDGLEPICREIGGGVKTLLKVGTSTYNQQPVKVVSIEIAPLEVTED